MSSRWTELHGQTAAAPFPELRTDARCTPATDEVVVVVVAAAVASTAD
jgi:hypothetical protein